jgi:isochorismate pyruvate lyase
MTEALVNPRRHVFTGLPSEERFGYCRAIEVGERVIVSGTAPLAPEGGVAPELRGDVLGQAREALARIDRALGELGLGLANVVRTTVWTTERERWTEAMQAHGEAFADVSPATSLVGAAFLVHPDLLVEIEVEALR